MKKEKAEKDKKLEKMLDEIHEIFAQPDILLFPQWLIDLYKNWFITKKE